MTITFYQTSDDAKMLDKTLTQIAAYTNATIRAADGISILNPVVQIADMNATLYGANYAHIQEYGRYYFIRNVRDLRTGLIEFSLFCDVLSTYKDGIRNLEAIIARQETEFNLYLPDEAFKAYAYPKIVQKKFPNTLGGANNLVLVVAGKSATPAT